MDTFKDEVIELVRQLDCKIEVYGEKYVRSNLGSVLAHIKYKGCTIVNYFQDSSVNEQGIIVEVLLESKFKDIKETIVTSLLNKIQIEKKEQLLKIFKGRENLLTDNIEKNVVIMSNFDRARKTLSKSIKVTTLGMVLATLVMIAYVQTEYNLLLLPLTLLIVTTAMSAMVMAASLGVCKTEEQKAKKHKKGKLF